MHCLLLGKLPPIVGGVSRLTYRTALDLAKSGHTVHGITTTLGASSGLQVRFDDVDRQRIADDSRRGLEIIDATVAGQLPIAPLSLGHDVVLSAALEAASARSPDVVVGWYMHPYGVAAASVSSAFGCPLVLLFAGSDLHFLAQNPALRALWSFVVKQASTIICSGDPRVRERLTQLGAPTARLRVPSANPSLDAEFERVATREQASPTPTLLYYGKVGEHKGTWTLLETLDRCARAGRSFQVLFLPTGRASEVDAAKQRLAGYEALAARTELLSPMSPWKIAALCRRVDLVFCLETGFPVDFHTTNIPREALASEACLICSAEVMRSALYRGYLVDGENCLAVERPNDGAELLRVLLRAVDDTDFRRAIALRGRMTSSIWERFNCRPDNPVSELIVNAARGAELQE